MPFASALEGDLPSYNRPVYRYAKKPAASSAAGSGGLRHYRDRIRSGEQRMAEIEPPITTTSTDNRLTGATLSTNGCLLFGIRFFH